MNNDAIGTLTQAEPTRNTQVPHAVVGGLPESKVRRVTAYIETNLHRELRLAELAAVTHMSPYHSRASSSGPRGYRRIASWFAAGSTPRRLC